MSNRTCTVPDCGLPYVARGYCRSHYNRWHHSGDPLGNVAPNVDECIRCGNAVPPKGASGPRSQYCTRACQSRASYETRRVALNARRREAARDARPAKACECCGEMFTPEQTVRQIYCSPVCLKRMQNAARRAKAREAFVENVHWRTVFARDGAACYLCGYDVNPDDFEIRADGTRANGLEYPTLEHVVALNAGGLHERGNVRLAHMYCNSVKGDRPLADVA